MATLALLCNLSDPSTGRADGPAEAGDPGGDSATADARPLTVRDAVLLVERYDLTHRRTSLVAPTVLLSMGSGLTLSGIITPPRVEGNSTDGTRSTGQRAGIGLVSGGLTLLLIGLPFLFQRRAKARATQKRLEELDRLLHLGIFLPGGSEGRGARGLEMRIRF